MGRKKISDGMVGKCISITKRQRQWLDDNPYFNFSESCRENLDDEIIRRYNGKEKT